MIHFPGGKSRADIGEDAGRGKKGGDGRGEGGRFEKQKKIRE